ncbi:hypothetical protein ACNF40_04095 [Cuniculiplasma sp. SKW4]|uniref:hypothetical protein n=1 Tax=Cuniculiplasma sp. SKW4 TaxID=3400171 RepID=UPI003FD62032
MEESNSAGIIQMLNLTGNPRSPIFINPDNWTYPMKLQYPVHYNYFAMVKDHNGYSTVYSSPEMDYLLPLEILGFALIIFSMKFRKLFYIPILLFAVTLGISAYLNNYFNIYSFVTQYYLFSSLIGFLISMVLVYRELRKRGHLKGTFSSGGT